MISIVIPLYNKETSIANSLNSIFQQEFSDFEVVIVDDGSTDNSVSIVESRQNSHIKLIKQKNGGPSKARNTGVLHASGEWILFIDADDEMLPNALKYFKQYIENVPDADMFLGEIVINDGKTKRLSTLHKYGFIENPFKEYAYGRLFQCSGSTLYKKSICLKHPFDERIRRYEDLQRLFNLYREYKLYAIKKPVAQINLEYSSASRARKDIKEDFLGYLDFKGKSFWEKMALYSFYLGEREYYPEQCRKLYPWLYRRYDLLGLYKIIKCIK